jgi:HlyD family secretion protein
MSAAPNPTRQVDAPEQAHPVTAPAPAPAPAPEQGKRRWIWVLGLLLLAGAAISAVFLLNRQPQGVPKAAGGPAGIRTTAATVGTLTSVLRVGGQTGARNFAVITAPRLQGPESRRGLLLMSVVDPGTTVRKGDVIGEIDGEAARDHIEEVQSTVNVSLLDIQKRQAEQGVETETLAQTLRVAKAEADKAQLDASAAEVRSVVDRELLQLSAEEAQAQHKQLQTEIGFQRAGHGADLAILKITTRRHELHRDRHINDLGKFTIRAPMPGLVVMQQIWRGGQFNQVKQGDQLMPGQTFAKVVDTSSMQVESMLNQAESSKVRLGMKARVGLDAFPDLIFEGQVATIGALATRGWQENYYIRSIPMLVSIEGSHPRLIPDLSAWAEIELTRKENATMVPVEALHAEGGKTFVYVKSGKKFEKREVQAGQRNYTHAEIVSGVRAGEEVALENPNANRPVAASASAQ